MTTGFPDSLRAVYVGGGLWLRVKVLTLPEAMQGLEGLEAAVMIAAQAAVPDDERESMGPMRGQSKRLAMKTVEVLQGVSKDAVIGYAWSESAKDAERRRSEAIADAYAALKAAVESAGEDEPAIVAAREAYTAALETIEAAHDIGPEPDQYERMQIVRNPQDENRPAGKFCFATLDQVSTQWATAAGNAALAAGLAAMERVSPLPATAK